MRIVVAADSLGVAVATLLRYAILLCGSLKAWELWVAIRCGGSDSRPEVQTEIPKPVWGGRILIPSHLDRC